MTLEPELLLSALADITRMRLVSLLSTHGELCVCELVQALDSPQPKVSKHLATLRSHSIILGRREGTWIHYRLNPELPTWASRAIENLCQGCAQRLPYRDDEARLAGESIAANC